MQSIRIIETVKSYQAHLTLLAEKGFNVTVVPLASTEKSFVDAINLEEHVTFVVDINAVDVIHCFLDVSSSTNSPISIVNLCIQFDPCLECSSKLSCIGKCACSCHI